MQDRERGDLKDGESEGGQADVKNESAAALRGCVYMFIKSLSSVLKEEL